MRRTIFCVLAVLVIGIISSHLLMAVPQESGDKDNYGKVIIQVVDVDTGEPVNEVFSVYFYNSLLEIGNAKSIEWRSKTNNKGHLVVELNPGIYYLQFVPESSESKYEWEPSPILSEVSSLENNQKIIVGRGEITEVVEKANYCGKLKIILVDPSGRKINPKEELPGYVEGEGISAFLSGAGLFGFFEADSKSVFRLTGKRDDLNDGEVIVGRLHPGKYTLLIYFGFLGISKQEIEGIEVFRNQTTVNNVLIDIDVSTGIEGYITDQNGITLKDLRVQIESATVIIDQNGYYKLVGLNEGRYIISIYSSLVADDDIFINKSFYIDIINKEIIRKDFVIEIK